MVKKFNEVVKSIKPQAASIKRPKAVLNLRLNCGTSCKPQATSGLTIVK
jgi:hypothetical protein